MWREKVQWCSHLKSQTEIRKCNNQRENRIIACMHIHYSDQEEQRQSGKWKQTKFKDIVRESRR